jgi:nitrate reductase gamma subunit
MKNLTLYPMSSYQTKIGGLIATAVALVLLAIVKLHGPFLFLTKPAPEHQADLLLAATVAGMYMVAFSKEKNDDERVHAIRAKSMQSALMILIGSMVAMAITTATGKGQAPGETMIDSTFLSAICAFGLSIHLILFHVGLYFDPAWAYNDDTVIPNIKKNKKFFIIYTIAVVLLFAVVFLIHKS